MNIGSATHELIRSLRAIYDEPEANHIADMIMEHITGMARSERILRKETALTEVQNSKFKIFSAEALDHKPVQYILHEAWFAGMNFYVDEHVLIPRPETEELVEWISEDLGNKASVLDIGTGSGCIPIALKKKNASSSIEAIDVCSEALNVAVNNALTHQTEIDFRLLDFLDEGSWNILGEYDIIVSNPPYISSAEKSSMKENVLDHEPHLALFATGDPLIFYRKIALFGLSHLSKNGIIYVELNEFLSRKIADIFSSNGYNFVEIKKDMQGKERMLRARR